MGFFWEYIAISIPGRIKQNCQQRREVKRLIEEHRQSSISIMSKIKK